MRSISRSPAQTLTRRAPDDACAFSVGSGTSVNLTLSGTNTLKSGYYYAGLAVPGGAALTITAASSDGELYATGGEHGAGIGGGDAGTGGTIIIKGGSITATGGNWGAGIGGGFKGSGGTISISGGTVIATGIKYGRGYRRQLRRDRRQNNNKRRLGNRNRRQLRRCRHRRRRRWKRRHNIDKWRHGNRSWYRIRRGHRRRIMRQWWYGNDIRRLGKGNRRLSSCGHRRRLQRSQLDKRQQLRQWWYGHHKRRLGICKPAALAPWISGTATPARITVVFI